MDASDDSLEPEETGKQNACKLEIQILEKHVENCGRKPKPAIKKHIVQKNLVMQRFAYDICHEETPLPASPIPDNCTDYPPTCDQNIPWIRTSQKSEELHCIELDNSDDASLGRPIVRRSRKGMRLNDPEAMYESPPRARSRVEIVPLLVMSSESVPPCDVQQEKEKHKTYHTYIFSPSVRPNASLMEILSKPFAQSNRKSTSPKFYESFRTSADPEFRAQYQTPIAVYQKWGEIHTSVQEPDIKLTIKYSLKKIPSSKKLETQKSPTDVPNDFNNKDTDKSKILKTGTIARESPKKEEIKVFSTNVLPRDTSAMNADKEKLSKKQHCTEQIEEGIFLVNNIKNITKAPNKTCLSIGKDNDHTISSTDKTPQFQESLYGYEKYAGDICNLQQFVIDSFSKNLWKYAPGCFLAKDISTMTSFVESGGKPLALLRKGNDSNNPKPFLMFKKDVSRTDEGEETPDLTDVYLEQNSTSMLQNHNKIELKSDYSACRHNDHVHCNYMNERDGFVMVLTPKCLQEGSDDQLTTGNSHETALIEKAYNLSEEKDSGSASIISPKNSKSESVICLKLPENLASEVFSYDHEDDVGETGLPSYIDYKVCENEIKEVTSENHARRRKSWYKAMLGWCGKKAGP